MANSDINWQKYLDVATISDVGMRRASNQDNLAVEMAGSLERWKQKGHLFMVADGMGAHAAGELASEIACEKIPQLYAKYSDVSAPEALKKAVIEANGVINRKGQANEEFFNMGTTCSVLTLLTQGAVVAHIGDSRVYRLRGNQISQLTFDHSLVWEMKASGQLTEAEEKSSLVPKNVITRSLGPYPDVKVDLEGPFPVEVNDTFLICSDGLTGLVEDDEIGSILANLSPQEAVQVLTDLTNLRGGPDNLTIVVVKIVHPDMTTARTAKKPLTIGTRTGKSKISAITWAGLIASLVATIILAFTSPVTAIVPGVLFLGFLLWLVIKLSGVGLGGTVVGNNQRFGRGPYVKVNCASGNQFVLKLQKITGELQKAAAIGGFAPLEGADRLIDLARQAANSNDSALAIKNYCRSLSVMMDEIRKRGREAAQDSSVDL